MPETELTFRNAGKSMKTSEMVVGEEGRSASGVLYIRLEGGLHRVEVTTRPIFRCLLRPMPPEFEETVVICGVPASAQAKVATLVKSVSKNTIGGGFLTIN